ncbi:Tigger transposable element derived 5 [Puccinia graminis f. sp. tritici]|uniref:Tigger transposable element derived 5 n=1 Tax=Puccinia graminis f. sp. tritici TaxID=56615 RepID=A0A5B0N446_PUCGR|nr:Tigger transposable element derived 5 [Puccinia graminis f. sp. tritici]KAA1088079.1 Tigger transposable element derived 5 [Puccinia graminis f. sp. tritici]
MTQTNYQEVYVSRFLDEIYITQTPRNPALIGPAEGGNELIKKLGLGHLQANLKQIKYDLQQLKHPSINNNSSSSKESSFDHISAQEDHLMNQLLQLNDYTIIPLTPKEVQALNRIDEYHHPSNASYQPIIEIIQVNQQQHYQQLQQQEKSSSFEPIVEILEATEPDHHRTENQADEPTGSNDSNPAPTPSKRSRSSRSKPRDPPSTSSLQANPSPASPISSATIFQKNQILDWYHSNGRNQTKTAKHFQTIYPELRIKQPLISAWLKNEESIRAKKNYVNENVKRMRMIQYPKVDDLLGEWAREAIQQNQHLTDQLLREKWKEFARLENIPPEDWLTLSHGWLSSFKARKGLKQGRRSSLSSSVNTPIHVPASSDFAHILPLQPPDISINHPDQSTSRLIPSSKPQPSSTIHPFSSSPSLTHQSYNTDPSSRSLPDPSGLHPNPAPIPSRTTNSLIIPSSSTTHSPQLIPLHPPHPPSLSTTSSSSTSSCSHSTASHSTPASTSTSIVSPPLPPLPPPTINQALHSIHLLLNYLPSTTTITSDETKLTISLIHALANYRHSVLKKINSNASTQAAVGVPADDSSSHSHSHLLP